VTTVGRKVNGERAVVLGWGRALLLQLAHPLVAAAVGDYSRFHHGAGGYLRRVRGTIGAMLDLTFAPEAEARAVVARINAIHDEVHGTLREPVGMFAAGTPYSARDPRLLIWVHVTLIESIVLAYDQFVEPLAPDERDTYAREAAWLAIELGVPASDLPRTFADVQAAVARTLASGEIAVGPTARSLSGALLSPLGPLASPLFNVTRLLTIGLLPDAARAAYGFDWDARRAESYRRAVAFVAGLRRRLPAVLTEWRQARHPSPR